MKEKVITKKKGISYRLFLLLMTPVLIGAFIFFIPQANSEWQKETKDILHKTPTYQGWVPMEYQEDLPL